MPRRVLLFSMHSPCSSASPSFWRGPAGGALRDRCSSAYTRLASLAGSNIRGSLRSLGSRRSASQYKHPSQHVTARARASLGSRSSRCYKLLCSSREKVITASEVKWPLIEVKSTLLQTRHPSQHPQKVSIGYSQNPQSRSTPCTPSL